MQMTIQNVIDMAKANGYKPYIVEGYNSWAWLITPRNNVITVSKAEWGNGLRFTFDYKANRNCGTGCSCHEDRDEWDWGLKSVTIKGLEQLEDEGLRFARKLNAPFYESVDEFLAYERKFWKEKLREVV